MEFLLNLNSWIKSLPASGKLSLMLVVVGAVMAGLLLTSQYQEAGYQYLFTNLSLTDANAIGERLQSMNVKAKIQGDAVLVPGDRVLELRNLLSAEGLPQGGGIGFEIFDKQNFGETEFQQRVNYVRAIQGELARTISAIDGVEKARVHLVMPEQSLFDKDQKNPTASIAMTMFKGRRLSDSQISGIVHLVQSSVEGLKEDHISVIDQNGNILFKGDGAGSAGTAKNMDAQAQYEKRMERSVIELVEKIVGPGSADVKVSAQMNFVQSERVVEAIDPESRVALSEQLTTDVSQSSQGSPGGAPGAASNTPDAAGASTSSGRSENTKRTESTTSFAVSKTTQKIIDPVGTVQKLSVAVLVDGTYEKKEDGSATYKPRSPEDLAKIEQLVRRAVGFNESRGDEVKVENLQFQKIDTVDVAQDAFVTATNSSRWTLWLMDNMKLIGLVAVLAVVFLLLIRLVNSYAPPVNVAYANIIGQPAARVAEALPPNANVNLVQRDAPEVKAITENIQKQLPEVQQRKGASPTINIVEQTGSITVETPVTSEEKLRLQAAKLQVEGIIKADVNEAVAIVRSWLAEG